MPKFQGKWIEKVVYLFGSLEDAREPSLKDKPEWRQAPGAATAKAASGCLIEIQNPPRVYQYVVTNRHVVENGLVKPRFSFEDSDGAGYAIDAVEDDWYLDILQTDLAVLPIHDRNVLMQVRGILLYGPGAAFLKDPKWGPDYSVNVGDTVAMPGRFYPASGGSMNRPVTRFGNIAAWPAERVHLSWLSDNPVESVLVEMRSHSGYSGPQLSSLEGLASALNKVSS